MARPRNNKRLVIQMMLWFGLISLTPLAIAIYLHFYASSKIVNETVAVNLYAVAQRQSNEIKGFLKSMEENASLFAQTSSVGKFLNTASNTQSIPKNYPYQSILDGFIDKFSLRNLYLIHKDGTFIYNARDKTVAKEPISKNVPFYHLFKRTGMVMSPQISDFIAAKDDSEPTLFFSAPVLYRGKYVGVVVAQAKANSIYRIVNNFTGFGKTGETVIVQQRDDQNVILNPTRHAPNIAFNPKAVPNPHSKPVEMALNGEWGFGEAIDYRNEPTLAAWEYLPNMRWGLIVKKDLAEVLEPIVELKHVSTSVAALSLLFALLAAIVATQRITRPILSLTKWASRIAQGDLTASFEGKVFTREIAILSQALEIMARNLKALIKEVKISSSGIVTTYLDTSKASQKQSEAAVQTAVTSIEISQSAKEIAYTSKSLLNTVANINELTQKTAEQAVYSRDKMHQIESTIFAINKAKDTLAKQFSRIKEKTDAIHSIIATMATVADRTNLLALNVAIEARQAGDAGLGFKVVAKQIRQLSDQTAMSSLEIEESIREMEYSVQEGILTMQQFSEKVAEEIYGVSQASTYLEDLIQGVETLPDHIENIFLRMSSQKESAIQIERAILKMSTLAQNTASTFEETNQNLSKLQKKAADVEKEISRFVT